MTTSSSIAHYIKEIGRGKDGARSLSRVQANDLFGLVLDGAVSDLEIGAFCLSMRIKGETTDELLGFIDAAQARINTSALPQFVLTKPIVVIPSYNGARKLPLLTPLLAGLLAQAGVQVLVHGLDAGMQNRVTSASVMPLTHLPSGVAYVSIAQLSPALKKLLDVRRVVGLRNSAHSVVKLINPYHGHGNLGLAQTPSLLVTSYTHPEYAVSMRATLQELQATALLLRGTEGEAVADPRRAPAMTRILNGQVLGADEPQHGSIAADASLPTTTDAPTTARYIQAVLSRKIPVPAPIAWQVTHILNLLQLA